MKKLANGKWKFYIAKFVRADGFTFHKFGVTRFVNAEHRFMTFPEGYAYWRDDYRDYYIKCVASIICANRSTAEKIEKYFLTKYPKNVSLLYEDHRWMPRKGFGGITEIYQCTNKKGGTWNDVYQDVIDWKKKI